MKKILIILALIFLGHGAHAMYCWEEVSGQFSHESKMKDKLGASNIVKVSTMLTAAGATLYECQHATEIDSFSSSDEPSESIMRSYWAYYGRTTPTNSSLNGGKSNAYWRNQYYCDVLSTTNEKFQVYGNNFEDYPIETTVSNSASGGPSVTKPGITTGRLYTYIYAKGAGAPYEESLYACGSNAYDSTTTYACRGKSGYSDNASYQVFLNNSSYYYTHLKYYVLHNPHYTHTFCTTAGGGGGGAAGATVNYIIKAD